ncbi:MAG: gamma-glutamyl-gamma-aminobutyrate hydrolase family protein [Gemmatimonadota bacterium]|nr:MAG: gamma-glutamyl-gamma-aminobutyrate hydrolase family protein [Gemmatimonadota bacterium]
MLCRVVRHVEIEDLGYLGEALERNGLRFEYVDAEALSSEIPAADFGGLIVLGGPVGAYEADRYPYLNAEIELIRACIADERPVLGICLGAQLLAAAAGARVYPGAHGKEIGWAAVRLTEAGANDPLWTGFPQSFTTFHWHGDTFDLPAGAELLARTESYVQAFRLGPAAYGVQFHPEVVPVQLDSWIRAYRLELERERLASDAVLGVPDADEHRTLAFQFGENTARWLHALS